jgi:hypothetical protein
MWSLMIQRCTALAWKNSFLVVCAGLFISAPNWAGQLPAGCRIATPAKQIQDWFTGDQKSFKPSEVVADLNQDGKDDVALLLRCEVANKPPVNRIFVRLADGPQLIVAEYAPGPFDFLWLYRKGEKDFSFDTMRYFQWPNNVLAAFRSETHSDIFTWNGQAFQKQKSLGDDE